MTTSIDRLVERLIRVERELAAQKKPQLAHSSIEDGSLSAYVEGDETMQIGLQFDGTSAPVVLTSPAPPAPSMPLVTPSLGGGANVAWDGTFVDDALVPMDYARVDVLVSELNDITSNTRIANSIVSARGGDAFVALSPGTYYVALVARNLAGKPSPISQIVQFDVSAPSGSDGEAPPPVTSITATGMIGAVSLRWPGVENNDAVTYKIHGEQLFAGQTDFTAASGNLIAATNGTYAVVRALANGAPIGVVQNVTEQFAVDTLNYNGSSGTLNCLTPGSHTWSVGDLITISGIDGHPEWEGTWPISTIDFLGGGPDPHFFALKTTVVGNPDVSNFNPTAVAAKTFSTEAIYGFKIIAEDADGAAIASSMVTVSPVQITSDDIAANSIATVHLAAGSVTAESIASEVILATTFLTAEEGARVEFGPDGLFIYASDGTPAFYFPTTSNDPDEPLTARFSGEVQALALAVSDFLTLDGQENQINKGGRVRLATGTTRPGTAPTPASGWESKNTAGPGIAPRGLVKVGSSWYIGQYAGVLTRLAEGDTAYTGAGNWKGTPASGAASAVSTIFSLTYLGGALYGTYFAAETVDPYHRYYRIFKATYDSVTDTWSNAGSWRFQPGAPYGTYGIGAPAITNDGTDLLVVQTNANGNVNVWKATTSNPAAWTLDNFGLRLTSGGTNWQPSEEIRDAHYGYEPAAARLLTQYNKVGTAITFTASTAHGLVVGQGVRIEAGPFSGAFTVTAATTLTFTVTSSSGVAGVNPLAAGAYAKPYVLFTTRVGEVTPSDLANAWVRLSGEWVRSPYDEFPLPLATENNGLAWDSSIDSFRSKFGDTIYKHTAIMWGSESSKWWSSAALASATYTTQASPARWWTQKKRAKVELSPPAIPPSADDADRIRVFISRGDTEPTRTQFNQLTELVPPETVTLTTMPDFTPLVVPSDINTFPQDAPAEITPATGVGPAFLRGNGESWLDPVGAIRLMLGTAHEGWLICDGTTIASGLYPLLEAKLGGTTLPLLVGRDTSSTPITMASGWTGADLAIRIHDGRAILEGNINKNAGSTGVSKAFDLTSQWRPSGPRRFSATAGGATAANQARMLATGDFEIDFGSATTGVIGVSGMSWRVATWTARTQNYFVRAF